MNYYRQGDVALIPINEPGATARKDFKPVARDGAGVVLQYGEVTGHKHQILERDVELFEPGEASALAERFLRVGEPSILMHEEHAAIDLPPGWYEVRRQREYAPAESRLVAD